MRKGFGAAVKKRRAPRDNRGGAQRRGLRDRKRRDVGRHNRDGGLHEGPRRQMQSQHQEHDGQYIGQKHVFLVYGSPCAGKTTYVQQVATRNDIIVDLDRIHGAICSCAQYDKPDATKQVAFALRDVLLTEIRTAGTRRRWQDAYIIGTYPDAIDRDNFVREYGAILVHIDTPREECIKRAYEDIKRRTVRDAVIGWIENFWKRFTP